MSVNAYHVTLTAEEPLRIGAGTIGQVVKSQPHVPGSVLRGALAARWIAEHGSPDTVDAQQREEFLALFEGAIRFGPLFPEGSALVPLPVSHCRYRPWPQCASQVVDAAHLPEPASDAPRACAHCGGPLQPGKGQLQGGVSLVDAMHAPLASDETAAEGNLHSREYLPAGTRLQGTIVGEHRWLDAAPGRAWIGGKRSVGGLASLDVQRMELPTPAAREDGLLHLELQAPGVFVDQAGRPLTSFPLHEIARVLEREEPEIVRSWTRMTDVGGWHAASRLPKPMDHALAEGSAVLLRFREGPLEEHERRLLAARGLGLRRSEGLGWVVVNPPSRASDPHPDTDQAERDGQPAADPDPEGALAVMAYYGHGADPAVGIPELIAYARGLGVARMHGGAVPATPSTGGDERSRSMLSLVDRLGPSELDDLVALLERHQEATAVGGST